MHIKYLGDQLVDIVVAYQLREDHLLRLVVAHQGKRKVDWVCLDFRGEAISIRIRRYDLLMNKNWAGLVKGIIDGERAIAQQ